MSIIEDKDRICQLCSQYKLNQYIMDFDGCCGDDHETRCRPGIHWSYETNCPLRNGECGDYDKAAILRHVERVEKMAGFIKAKADKELADLGILAASLRGAVGVKC